MGEKIKKYAEGTKVSIRDTKSHIERELGKYGVKDHGIIVAQGRAAVTFRFQSKELSVKTYRVGLESHYCPPLGFVDGWLFGFTKTKQKNGFELYLASRGTWL